MASIKKLKSGAFQATVYVGRDENGKNLREYITCNSEKECKNRARQMELSLSEGKFVSIPNMKLSKWFDEWLDLNENRLAPSTYVLYKLYIDTHYKPAFKNLKLSQINDIHVKKFMNEKLKTLCNNTVRKLLHVLGEILEDRLKFNNPVRQVKFPEKQKTRFRLISDDEFQKIWEVAKQDIFDELIILLAAWNGMRRGEIFALFPNDIKAKDNMVIVDEARSISKDGYVDKRPKVEKSIRKISTPEYLMDLLVKYRSMQGTTSERLFKMRPDSWSKRFKKIIEKTNLTDVVFHDLRHYHASWLFKNNIPDLYAAERLGHDWQTLKNIYQHMYSDIKKQIDSDIVTKLSKTL